MTSEIEPNGNIFTHEFNPNGRVTKVSDQENGWKNYNKIGNNYVIETAAGNRSEIVMDGINKQSTSFSGLQRNVSYSDNGMTKTVQTCGIKSLTHYTLDQKTGDEVIKDQTLTLPSGKTLTTSIERVYAFNEDKTTKTLSIKITSNRNTAEVNTDYTQGVTTTTSAMGRITKSYFDTNTLLPTKEEIAGLHPTSYSYDNKGRLIAIKTDDRQQDISYDSRGNITSLTDEQGKVTRFSYDLLDRLLKTTTPSGAELQYKYDQNGNLTVITTPTASDHQFKFNSVNKTTAYTSALGSVTSYEYNNDRKLQKVTYPSGKYKKNNYTSGLLTSVETPEGTSQFEYDCLENLSKVTYANESINYSYDGSLLTGIAYAGILNQSISLDYDKDLRISQLSYADGNEALTYDKDGLLTNRGKFTINRNPDNGIANNVTDGSLEIGRQYNAYGELTQEASYINGNAVFSYATTRNKIGKIITKTETIAAQSIQYEYSYDADGRLIKVIKNGNSVETYQYDANGNRTDTNVNEDDQIINYQGIEYRYDDDGYLSNKQDTQGTTTYEYGIFGELKKVELPDGTQIEYLHNANHQRVAKKVNGVIVEKYLWQNLTTLLAIYDKDDNLLMRFNYADNRMPVSMEKNGQSYYLHYDQVGTLKLVSDNAGNIIKQVDYDSYGNVLNDSDTNFKVPFGFAGGLYDQDTQLVRFGYRDYDAFSGRWTAKDPIGFDGGAMHSSLSYSY
jgi:RHS repeat-associated protein